ncbi:hypothetical protein NPX99_03135 [Bartonella sp. 220]|uniref:hypothetical protein n=1 Tax=Bartonella sp. 220B TaxID=2967260 RepID=UPI0022A931C6|nr:hypothetical protein [Bartonella sp. 220B]MCZ2158279.1 hypothetical protein [Bartonella sp. 220B]
MSSANSSGVVGANIGRSAGVFIGDVGEGLSSGGAGIVPGAIGGAAIGSGIGYGVGGVIGFGSRYDACYY